MVASMLMMASAVDDHGDDDDGAETGDDADGNEAIYSCAEQC